MARKKSEKNVDISLDINAESEIMAPEVVKKVTASKPSPEIAAKVEIDSNEYTIDPHTGEKYLKPKGTSDVISYQSFNIPQIRREGYVIIAPTDEKKEEIQKLINQGYEFVDKNTPGCEEIERVVHAGNRKDGSPFFHKFLQMPEAKFRELEGRRQAELTKREDETIYNPTAGDSNMYIGKEFRAPTVSRNNMPMSGGEMARDMDIGMSNAYKNAMR